MAVGCWLSAVGRIRVNLLLDRCDQAVQHARDSRRIFPQLIKNTGGKVTEVVCNLQLSLYFK